MYMQIQNIYIYIYIRISRDPLWKGTFISLVERTSTVNEDPVIALNLHLTEPRYYWMGLRGFVIGLLS